MNRLNIQTDCLAGVFSRRMLPLCLLLFAVLLGACSDMKDDIDPLPEPQPVAVGQTCFRFHISLAEPGAPTTRAGETGESVGSDHENAIRSFYVFIFDGNYGYVADINLTGKVENNTEYLYSADNLTLKSGTHYMVAFANLTPEQYEKVKAMGTLPTERRINDIFLRIVRQLDYLYRTADMMNTRLDDLQNEIDDLVRKNVE